MNNVSPVVPVSVVIPCYQCALTIGRALDSVFAQTVKPAEIILVDDCSGDETMAAIRELMRTHADQMQIVQMNINMGAASARNAGWEMATQPYIAFLDADDSWHPEKLHIQHEYMRNNPHVALSGHQCALLRVRGLPPVLPKRMNATKISPISLLFRNAFSTPTVMLKRDIPFRFQEGVRYLEDLLLWQKIAFAGLQVVLIESPLAYVHKPFYGVGGLSAQLWKMEKGELRNIVVLYKAGSISFLQFAAATLFSITKFIKRVLVSATKGLGMKLKAVRKVNG